VSDQYCKHCGHTTEPNVSKGEKRDAILRAMSRGPRTLGQLATAVHGRDTATNRRKVSYLIAQSLRGVLESDGKGTWSLVGQGGRLHSVNDRVAEMFRMFT
jgi:hypothetical protein